MKNLLIGLLLVSMAQATNIEYQEGKIVAVEPMTKGFCENGIDKLLVVHILSNKRTILLDCSSGIVGEVYWIKLKVNNNALRL